MVNEPVQVIAGGGETVVAHVAQHVIGAVDVELARHQRMQPRQHRGVLAGVQLGRGRRVKHVAGDQQRDLRRLAERRSSQTLVEHFALHDIRQRVPDPLVHRIPAGALRKQASRALRGLRVAAEMLVQRELEVVTERQMPEIVKQRRQPQTLLDQQHRHTILLVLVAAGEKTLLGDRPLRISADTQRRVTLHKRPTATEHLRPLCLGGVRQRGLEKPGGQMHRAQAVRHPRDPHLGKHQVRGG